MASWLKSYQLLKGNHVDFQVEVLQYADPTRTDFHREIDLGLRQMADEFAHRPLYLALSGGLDSEYVGNSLIRNKIPFTPVLMRIGTYNDLEVCHAEYWCKRNNIKPYLITVDPVKLLNKLKATLLKEWITCNLGGLINVMIADYVETKYNGALVAGSGDCTVHTSEAAWLSNDGTVASVKDPVFYYWDADVVLEHLRPGRHPCSTISYFPETLYSWIYNYDTNLTEQESKSQLYDIPVRPKADMFELSPEYRKFFLDLGNIARFTNFRAGTQQKAIKWLTESNI